LPVLIIGAGIAGLTLSLALAKRNISSLIFERSETLEPIGAGLQISPNNWKALASLGLEAELRDICSFPDHIALKNGETGKTITQIPLGASAEACFGAPYGVAHRGDLQDLLLKVCRNNTQIELRLGVQNFKSLGNGDKHAFSFRHGDQKLTPSYDVLVGADGVHSKVRQDIMGLSPPIYRANKTAWRSTVPTSRLPEEIRTQTTVWLASGAHMVAYPMQNGASVNLVLILPNGGDGNETKELGQVLPNSMASIRCLMSLANQWKPWPLLENAVEHVSPTHPNAILIGDAAHAMLPFAAQGAAMAIEDAVVLADLLGQHDSTQAIKMFDSVRKKRNRDVQELARNNGRIYHLPYPMSAGRDIVMKTTPARILMNRMAWIYGWKPPKI